MNACRKLIRLRKCNTFDVFRGSLTNAFCYDNDSIVCRFAAIRAAINSHDVMYGQPKDVVRHASEIAEFLHRVIQLCHISLTALTIWRSF